MSFQGIEREGVPGAIAKKPLEGIDRVQKGKGSAKAMT